MDFLTELFESQMYNILRLNFNNKQFSILWSRVNAASEEPNALLSGKEKELFSQYVALQEKYVAENEFGSFTTGFRLGLTYIDGTFKK